MPPTVDRRLLIEEGKAISKAPNIEAASAMKTAAIPITTHLLPRAAPIIAPVKAETTPSAVKSDAIPRTKTPERAAPRQRDFASVAPNTATVIGTIGKTQGVRLLTTPKPKEA